MTTAAERRTAHRAGRSSGFDKRFTAASKRRFYFSPGAGFVHRSRLHNIAGAATTADKAYWVYLGCSTQPFTAAYVKAQVTTGAAAGAQTAEVAIATSSTGPSGAAKTLTVVAKTGTLDDLTGTGLLGNSSSLAYTVPADTHVWIGFRENMAGGRPQLYGLTFDGGAGEVLSTATAGVLAVGTSYTGALITSSAAWMAPALVLVEG